MSSHSKTQVLIVGAGPTGLSMAVQLLRYDIDFIIIDKKEKASQFSKAIAVQARSLEIFNEVGLAEKAVSAGSILHGLNVFKSGKKKARLNLQDLGKGISKYDFALSLAQNETERLLEEYISSHGKNIVWNANYSHYTENDNLITAFYKDENQIAHTIEAKYMVGADGASSKLREEMGLGFKGDTVPKLFYVADVKLKSATISDKELSIFLIERGFILLLPMKGNGSYRIVGMLPEKDKDELQVTFEKMISYIKKNIQIPVEFSDTEWFSTYKVHTRKASTFCKGRVFLAGDAAHIHTPAGGQGMNTGIQDAYDLAWKIAYVLQKKIAVNVLQTYDEERGENAVHLLKTTDRVFDIMAGTNWFWDFLRLKIFPIVANYISTHKNLNKFVFPLISQTGIQYSPNQLTIKNKIGKAEAGVRIPYFLLQDKTQILEHLKEPCFKLLFFGKKEKDNFADFKSFGIPVSTMQFSEMPKKVFQGKKDFYILLRPDNHIMYIGKYISICNQALQNIMFQHK